MKGKYPNTLEQFMKRAQIGPTELARLAGTSKQNVDRHADGSRQLTPKWAKLYAPHVGASIADLIIGPHPKPKARRGGEMIHVPLLTTVPAGRLWATEGVSVANVRRTLAASGLPAGDWIALEVEGDSMNRIAPDGSIIFVNRADKKMVRDNFYVFATENSEYTFKRFRPGPPDRLLPYSTNPDHETIRLEEPYFVVGRVKRVTVDL